jgi:hypothetical protein
MVDTVDPIANADSSAAAPTSIEAAKPVVKISGVPDFLKAIKAPMAAPKQQYSGAANPTPGAPGESTENPNGGPVGGPDSPSQVNMDPDDRIRKEAALWVFGLDLGASRALKFWSKIGTVEEFKMAEDEKKDLESALTDYFKTLPETPKMPAWVVLLFTVLMIFASKAIAAHKLRKESTKKKKSNPLDNAIGNEREIANPLGVNNTSSGRVIKFQAPKKPKKQSVKKRIPAYNPDKPYWDQQYSGKGMKIINPVSEGENNQRQVSGGSICLNCQTNYAKAGKNACSQHCSGKLKKKSNVSS